MTSSGPGDAWTGAAGCPATAGNISVRIAGHEVPGEGRIAITRSGGHKGFLDAASVMEVDLDGRPMALDARPSAETLLHCQIYRACPDSGAVLHGHSVAGTVLSMVETADRIAFSGYELFKAFAGQRTHEATLALPLFDNDQDIGRLAGVIAPHLAACPLGYYIRGHGAYVWAATWIPRWRAWKRWSSCLSANWAAAGCAALARRSCDEPIDGDPRHHALGAPELATEDPARMAAALAAIGVRFERWQGAARVDPDAESETILAAYRPHLDALLAGRAGSADVLRLRPGSHAYPAMRAKFLDEHIHTEDEVRFFIQGGGHFILHENARVYDAHCTEGDLISVPAGLKHWFDAGAEPNATGAAGVFGHQRVDPALYRRHHQHAVSRRRLSRWMAGPADGHRDGYRGHDHAHRLCP